MIPIFCCNQFGEFLWPAWAVASCSSGPQAGGTPKLIATEYMTQGAELPCNFMYCLFANLENFLPPPLCVDVIYGSPPTDLINNVPICQTEEILCIPKDLLNILPYIDPLILLEVTGEFSDGCLWTIGFGREIQTVLPFCFFTGEQVFQCLENGVSQLPKLEGRFPQVKKNKLN